MAGEVEALTTGLQLLIEIGKMIDRAVRGGDASTLESLRPVLPTPEALALLDRLLIDAQHAKAVATLDHPAPGGSP